MLSWILAINNPVPAIKSDRIMLCRGGPGYVPDAKIMIAGKLNAANIGLSVELGCPLHESVVGRSDCRLIRYDDGYLCPL